METEEVKDTRFTTPFSSSVPTRSPVLLDHHPHLPCLLFRHRSSVHLYYKTRDSRGPVETRLKQK